jgi:hypothetical protein
LLVLALLLACFASVIYGGVRRQQGTAIAVEASRRLRLGLTRSEADQAVGEYAKRYRCSESDLYLFGSSDPNLAGMLVLWYDRQADRDVLRSISGLDVDQLNQFAQCAASG